jgi:hypothetical protein
LLYKRRCDLPCFTLVQIEVKDKTIAETTLKHMNVKGTITQNSNKKTWTVAPESPPLNFKEKFNTEYGVLLATKRACAEGYTVSRAEENGETVLYLRNYNDN